MNMFVGLAIVLLTLRGKSYSVAHTTRPYPTKFPSNTFNALENLLNTRHSCREYDSCKILHRQINWFCMLFLNTLFI